VVPWAPMIRRALGLLVLVPGHTACASADRPAIDGPAARAATDEVRAFVRDGWHMPLEVHARGSSAAPEQRARDEALVVRQLGAVRETYDRAAFDFFTVAIDVSPDADEPSARVRGGAMEIVLPAPGQAPAEPLGADALLEALARGFDWKDVGRWWDGQPQDLLDQALARDLRKLEQLETELGLDDQRLELLAASVQARSAATEQELTLTPTEASFARAAQFRITFALHRLLNTLARWRAALLEPGFPRRAEVALVLLRARLLHEGHLGWFLTTVVGRRPTLAVWEEGWWHRRPLYTVLDAQADMDALELEPGQASIAAATSGAALVHGPHPTRGSVPAGAVRALLDMRLDGSLGGYFDDIDAAARDLGPASFAHSPLRDEALRALARVPASRALVEEKSFPAFTAWKELWDARLKNGFSFPLYHAIVGISTWLGDTRTTDRAPAVSDAQLHVLEERLRPGDIILVRQDGFLSNAFLPGFWPHAILWLGPQDAWTALHLSDGTALAADELVRRVLPQYTQGEHPARCIEAVSEGVVFSSVEHALGKDYVVILRPELPEAEVAAAIRRALTCFGRPYDFDFDFATDDRIVCSELVYRAYNPDLNFRVQVDAVAAHGERVPGLVQMVGRCTMPANEIARYALYMAGHPEPAPTIGYPGCRLKVVAVADRHEDGATLALDDRALDALRSTVDR
jgi:hypothetical protein